MPWSRSWWWAYARAGESDESAEFDQGAAGASVVDSPLGDYASEAACFYARPSGANQERAIRDRFVDPGGAVRLLNETATVRPGETFVVAVANDGDEEVLYGQGYELERLQDGQWVDVEGEPEFFAAIGFTAAPGGVGSCVGISVPSAVEAEMLRVVMAGVSDCRTPADEERPIRTSRWPELQSGTRYGSARRR